MKIGFSVDKFGATPFSKFQPQPINIEIKPNEESIKVETKPIENNISETNIEENVVEEVKPKVTRRKIKITKS